MAHVSEIAERLRRGITQTPLRARARDILLDRPSSGPLAMDTAAVEADRISQQYAREVIDFCLRAGEAMLSAGASAADVVATVLRVAEAYDIRSLHVDIAFTSITVSMHRGSDVDPISVMRIVRNRTTDYTRLREVYQLIADITVDQDPIGIDEARDRLTAALNGPHPYRRWVVMVGKMVLAGGVVVMYGASFVLIFVAAFAAALSDVITRRLGRWGVPEFFVQIVSAVAITSIAALMYWLRSIGLELPGSNSPTVIVIAGIIMLLSGIGLTTAAGDAIDGYYVTASARGFEVIMLTLGLAIGISLTLSTALRIGVPVDVQTSLGANGGLWFGIIGAGLIGAGFALTSYIRIQLVPLMALCAGLVYALYYLLLPILPQPGVAPAMGGLVAGAIGYLVYHRMQVPEAATAMAGVAGLIPGLAVYRALYGLMDSEYAVSHALPALVAAVATGLGLAAGTSIGSYLTRRIFGLDRQAQAASRYLRAPHRDDDPAPSTMALNLPTAVTGAHTAAAPAPPATEQPAAPTAAARPVAGDNGDDSGAQTDAGQAPPTQKMPAHPARVDESWRAWQHVRRQR